MEKTEKHFCKMLTSDLYKVKIKALQSFHDFLISHSDPRHKLVSAYIEFRSCKSDERDKLYARYEKIKEKLEKKFLDLPKNMQRYILFIQKLAFPFEVHIATTPMLNKFGKLLDFSNTVFIGVLKLEKQDVNLVIPEWVTDVSYMGKLDLSDNNLSSLNDFSGNLDQLPELDLDNNNLQKIPDTVSVLQSLTRLIVSNNKLRTLPDSLCELKKLSILNLNKNRLEKLPDNFTELGRLVRLGLANNKLKEIPANIDKLASLSHLDLSNNQLTELPKAISELKNLEVLKLGGNRLNKIPEFIWKLKKLTYLDLGKNGLLDISDSIANLKQLKILDLSGNILTRLPDSIAKIRKLEELHVDGNNLVEIPASVNKLRDLRIFGAMGRKQIENSLKDSKKDPLKAAKKMALKNSSSFYPVSDWVHMEVCAGYSEYPGTKGKDGGYNPYLIPKGDDKEEQNEINDRTLYGAMDILAMQYVSSEEWGCNDELDTIVGDVFSLLYNEASEALNKLFGEPLAQGNVKSLKQTYKKLVGKLSTGDELICSIWMPDDQTQGFYLLNSMSSGDGDFINIIWICCLPKNV